MKFLLWLLLLPVAGLGLWLYFESTKPPELAFARAQRQRLESTVTTNGKIEPIAWAAARAEREGLITEVPVREGQRVAQGAPLAWLDTKEARAQLASAEARIDEAKASLDLLLAGGRAAEIAEIDSGLRRAEYDREEATREIRSIEKLIEKNAAPRQELTEWRARFDRAQLLTRQLEDRRRSLVDRGSIDAARARLKDAEAQAGVLRRRLELAAIRAPLAGVVYSLEARPGAWLAPGTLAAMVGQIDRVKVIVYVDEPELGRVRAGLPVRITWDAFANREWKGVVDQTPTEIVSLNTRQVGKVTCLIDNPGAELLPGTNINAFILSKVVDNALSIPKETLRREGDQLGVYVLTGQQIRWKPLKLGVSSVTRIEVLSGLNDKDAIALPSELPLKDGLTIRPVFP